MQYGAMNFPVRPVLEELEQIASLGFDYLELSMDPPQAHHSTILQQKSILLERLHDFGMQIVCHMPTFLCLADLTESIRIASIQETLASLDVAAELEPLKVVLHPGYVTGLGIFVFDKAKEYATESLTDILEHAEKLGLTVCLENMFPRANSLTEPNDFAPVFERFPGLKLTLDTGHANIGTTGGKRIREFLSRFPDRIEHIHASDNFGKEDNHLPIGTGTIDFSRFTRTIKEMGYDKTVTFEVFSRDKDYLKASREKFKTMLAQSVDTNV
ncbi:sugar phosphate isomerase/epimerase family protein [Desulfomonile tiedjei]|uniref:Sugar phosphate isomerase/epimerase n=1 Tax=Desulfomonile tiedjei (strain ATCC 49306 / DSM 6799 / DCB-1) TaxID=706587 RepID=I4CBE4_DESTA|nr:sugar phosphate isomerase/epimerase [Desulfomonile tiedjei]AFM26885.1 sugar phosphate isomerase/epimerase [Desulfomonile tiedjei DSM 6799]